jgi:hypothetical protein
MTIYPIVEGHGEVSAVPLLLRRLIEVSQAYHIQVARAIRRRRSELAKESGLRSSIKLARLHQDCQAILVILDADDDCPKELGPTLRTWAAEEARGVPCEIVLANHEYEAWFLSAIESLRGQRGIRPDSGAHPSPEAPRDAKGVLEQYMRPQHSYSETADQAALTALFDMKAAYKDCRSFRRMVKAYCTFAICAGVCPECLPPAIWNMA